MYRIWHKCNLARNTGGRGRGGTIDGGYWERMSQGRQIGKMLLNAGFPFLSCLSLHHQNNRLEIISVFYFPLSKSVGNQKPILR